MTQPHLIEQAQQGDPQAIAALMNKSLQEKGMVAYVDRFDDSLEVILEAERVPNRQALTAFVEKGIQNLGIESIRSIRVSGQQFGADTPAWTQELFLETPIPEFEPEADLTSDLDLSPTGLENFSVDHDLDNDLFSPNEAAPAELLAEGDDFSLDTEPALTDMSLEAEVADLFQQDQSMNELSQLQELLSDSANPLFDNQRQDLEEQLGNLWAEQSESQSEDFLSELLSDTPQASDQFEGFLDSSSEDSTSIDPSSSNLWVGDEGSEPPAEGFLEDVLFEQTLTDPDSNQFQADLSDLSDLSDQSSEFWTEQPGAEAAQFEELVMEQPMEQSSESGLWLEEPGADGMPGFEMSDSDLPDDEPDEVLLSFLEDQPVLPIADLDEEGELLDEPDEILLDFLSEEVEKTQAEDLLSEQIDLSTNSLEAEPSPVLDLEADAFAASLEDSQPEPQEPWMESFEDNSETNSETNSEFESVLDSTLTDPLTNPLEDFSPDFTLPHEQPQEEDFLANLETPSFNDLEAEESQDWLAEQPTSQPEETNDFSLDWQPEATPSLREDPLEELISPATAEPTFEDGFGSGLGTEDASTADESMDFLMALPEDTTAEDDLSWGEPSIELLQEEPDPPLPDMTTDQLDELGLYSEDPDLAQSLDLTSVASEPPEEFPQDFLTETEEAPIADLSPDFMGTDPEDNPFLEQLEGQTQPTSPTEMGTADEVDSFDSLDFSVDSTVLPEETPDLYGQVEPPLEPPLEPEFGQFSQAEWQLAQDSADQSDLDLSDLELSGLSDAEAELAEPDLMGTSTDDLNLDINDEELIHFFQEDSEPIDSPATAQFDSLDDEPALSSSDPDWQSMEWQDVPQEAIPTQPPEVVEADSEPALYGEPMAGAAYTSADDLNDDEQPYSYEEPSQAALEEQLDGFYNDNTADNTIDNMDNVDDNFGNNSNNSASSYTPPPEAPVIVDPASESRNSPWLFPLILLGISGWIVGLISFAFLWSRLSSPPAPEPVTVAPATPVDPTATAPEAVASPEAVPTLACTPAAVPSSNRPVDLSSVQFQPNAANPQQINVVGCVTNRSQRPLDLVSVAYRTGAAASPTVGGLNFADSVIEPGQTVAFTSNFTLPSDINRVNIDTLYWQTAGAATSQEARTSIVLNR